MIDAPCHVLRRQVAHDGDLRLRSRFKQRPLGVIFAVGAGEHGNERLRAGDFDRRGRVGRRAILDRLRNGGLLGSGGVDILQHRLIGRQQLRDEGAVAVQEQFLVSDGYAQLLCAGEFDLLRQLRDNGPGHRSVPVRRDTGREADPVAEGHVHHRFGNAVLHGPGRFHLARGRQRMESLEYLRHVAAPEQVDRVARRFELR